MTREGLRDYVDKQRALNNIPYHVYSELIDGIDTLEQEPTTKNDLGVDAVRRKAVLNTLDNMDSALDNEDRTVETYKELLKECYKVLPSVTPQEQFKPMVEIDLYSVIKQKYIEREVLDKISAEIQRLRGCSCSCSDGIIDDVEDIIDKYKAESEG